MNSKMLEEALSSGDAIKRQLQRLDPSLMVVAERLIWWTACARCVSRMNACWLPGWRFPTTCVTRHSTIGARLSKLCATASDCW